jgi:hypothetical protein
MTPAVAASPVFPVDALLWKAVRVTLTLETPDALVTVLTTVARLGCHLSRVEADGVRAVLAVLAPARVAHRVAPLLDQLVDVLAVAEAEDGEEPGTRRRPVIGV